MVSSDSVGRRLHRLGSLVLRRRYLIAGAVAVAFGAVTVVAYLSPKAWEATTTVRLDPLQVAGLQTPDATQPTRDQAITAELAAARGRPFHDAVIAGFKYPVTYSVEGDADAGTLRFAVRADSAERAVSASYTVANSYLASRAQPAVTRAEELNAQIAQLQQQGNDPDQLAVLQASLAATNAALEQLQAGVGVVSDPPGSPDNPASPDFAARLVAAAAIGLLVGLALAWVVDRRAAGSAEVAEAPPDEPASGSRPLGRVMLGGLAILLPVLLFASVVGAVVSIWRLRPSTNKGDEYLFECLPLWLDPIPDGTAVAVASDNLFFQAHFAEFAYPRLVVAEGIPPDVVLHITPGPGPEACGNYFITREQR